MTQRNASSATKNLGVGAYSGSHFDNFKDSTFVAAENVYIESIKADSDGYETQKVVNWLTHVRFGPIQHDTLSKRTTGTGEWFVQRTEFKDWISGEQDVLWVQGIPGAGKTILASIIVEYLQLLDARSAEDTRAVVFLYCRHDVKCTVTSYLASLAIQLYQRYGHIPSVSQAVHKLYAAHFKEESQPSKTELINILTYVVSLFSKVYIVLDALDEVPDHDQIDLMECLLASRGSLLLTSRPIGVDTFNLPPRTIHLSVDDHNQSDINTFLHERINRITSISRITKGDKNYTDEVCERIVNLSKGMFILAALRIESLRGVSTRNNLDKALKLLPKDLEATYLEALNRVNRQDGDYPDIAKRTITWISYAAYPLSIDELQHALAINDVNNTFDDGDIPPKDVIIAACCGLIEVHPGNRGVRLIHYTAYDFFRKHPEILIQFPHSYLGRSCISYLTAFGFTQLDILSDHDFERYLRSQPLMEYTYCNWEYHIRQCHVGYYPMDIVSNFILQTINYPIQLYAWLLDWLQPIHVIAYYGLQVTIRWHELDINSCTQGGNTALMIAALQGHDSIITSLFSIPDININLQNNDGETALFLASRESHNKVVKSLLSFPGIDVNLQKARGWTALLAASRSGNFDVVKSLLSIPNTNVNLQNDYGETALFLASQEGHKKVVNLLLSCPGIDVNLQNQTSTTALWAASESGNFDTVQLLLSIPDVNVNLQNNNGLTALFVASLKGHNKVVELLLSFPDIDVNLQDINGCTALLIASRCGKEEVIKSLLASGSIDINQQSNHGSSAITLAAEFGQFETLKALLDSPGINVNLSDYDGDTALLCACHSGKQIVVELLLSCLYIDVNKRNQEGHTALSIAAQRGYQGIIEKLRCFPGIQY